MEEFKDLAIECLKGNYQSNGVASWGSKTFKVSAERMEVIFWNSSNSEGFSKENACREISNELLEEKDGGSFSCPQSMNEIMWQIKYI